MFTSVPMRALPDDVRLVTSADGPLPELAAARPPNWDDDEWDRLVAGDLGPWAIALVGDRAASICHTPGGVTADAAEAGVWTHPENRGRRLAELTTSAWAQLASATRRHLFYSTDRDNAASQRVAAHLGLRRIGWGWKLTPGPWPEGDAWGHALANHRIGSYVPRVELETGDGDIGLAMRPDWFFRSFPAWDWWERELLPHITAGPVLDLGAGAGRASLWFQDRGLDVTAVENSVKARHVCRQRGVVDVRLGDLNDPPADKPWGAVLLLRGNLGLGGSHEAIRALLIKLAHMCAPGAVLIGDTVDPGESRSITLRIRYRDEATPWWPQYNVPVSEIPAVVEGTGWTLQRHLVDLPDHAVLLRRL